MTFKVKQISLKKELLNIKKQVFQWQLRLKELMIISLLLTLIFDILLYQQQYNNNILIQSDFFIHEFGLKVLCLCLFRK
jgi:hypothetical protein